jgi:DUF917 family protein
MARSAVTGVSVLGCGGNSGEPQIGAVLLKQNDERPLQHRYMQIEGMAELTPPLIDAETTKLPLMAA